MEITNVQLDMIDNPKGKLRAFCSLTLDREFVVKNFKVIKGNHGLFVAMPSRKLTKPCYECDNRVFRDATYCDRCGNKFGKRGDSGHYDDGESHADIAFPIEDDFRERLEDLIIEAYRHRLEGDDSVVEHRNDEDYDLLDFDFEGHMEQRDEAGQETDENRAVSGAGEEDTGSTGALDLFSNPNARLRSTRRTSPPSPSSRPSSSSDDTQNQPPPNAPSPDDDSPLY